MNLALAGETFAVELEAGSLAKALQIACKNFLTDAPATWTLRFRCDDRAEPLGPRQMPVMHGNRITGAGFEATLTGRHAEIVGANERFGIESVLKLMLAAALLPKNRMLVHSVAVSDGTRCAVLLGERGAGKSTLGARASDAGLLRLADERVVLGDDGRVHGTPWNTGLAKDAELRLLGTLGWSDTERLEPLAPADFLPLLLSNTLLPDDSPATRSAVFSLATRLLKTRPERFYFSPTAAAPAFLRETLISRANPSRPPTGG